MRRLPGAALLAAAALLLAAGGASAATVDPPLPGGKYAGKTRPGARVLVKVLAGAPRGVLQGVVTAPCGRKARARFKTATGRWVATRRNRRGRIVFRATGSFASPTRARGTVRRLQARRRLGPGAARRCRPARFAAPLKRPAGVRSARVRYGPYDLDASAGPEMPTEQTQFRGNVPKPCSDCYLVGILPELTFADGSTANLSSEAMLHHAVLTSMTRMDASCAGWPERFFAAGNERTPFVLPRGYGYRVLPGDRWGLLTELMNMAPEPQTLYLEVSFYFIKAPAPLKRALPLWLDIDNCGDSRYSIPAGPSDTHSDFTVPTDLAGDVVAIGGHLHDEGVRIEATNETRGTSVCNSRAGYGRIPAYMGTIESMSGCTGDPLAPLSAGDTLRLHSVYESEAPRDDVMGIMLAYLSPG